VIGITEVSMGRGVLWKMPGKKLFAKRLHVRIMDDRRSAMAGLAADAAEKGNGMNWLKAFLVYWRRWSEVI
jgi:hypothetical protein